jgi:hypothetical protein
MRQSLCLAVAALSTLGVVAHASDANAQKPADPPAAAATPRESEGEDEDREELKHFALTLNPLSLILTRIGINVEYMLARHHGIMVNPFFQSISADSNQFTTKYTNIGGELAYHFYTGNRGANGFFVGPFVTFISQSVTSTGGGVSAEGSATIFGGGLDLGGQHVFRNGFTIGAGGGVMYLKQSAEATATNGTLTSSGFAKFDGVFPRFLFTIGWSF